MSGAPLERIEAVVGGGGDADDVLRSVVAELAGMPGFSWAGISFLESGTLELGPEAGTPSPAARYTVPIAWQGTVVGELAVDGTPDGPLLEQVAALIADHVLLGWDTGGESWDP